MFQRSVIDDVLTDEKEIEEYKEMKEKKDEEWLEAEEKKKKIEDEKHNLESSIIHRSVYSINRSPTASSPLMMRNVSQSPTYFGSTAQDGDLDGTKELGSPISRMKSGFSFFSFFRFSFFFWGEGGRRVYFVIFIFIFFF
jgi:hypothetical protein